MQKVHPESLRNRDEDDDIMDGLGNGGGAHNLLTEPADNANEDACEIDENYDENQNDFNF